MNPQFGIIGCGNISHHHFEALQKAGASVVHVVDLNEAAARPYVQLFGARYSANYQALIEDPEVSVVSVLTNAKSHKDICLTALQSGKDVICEKTITNNVKEATQVVNAVRASGQLFFSAYMKRFFPAVQKAKNLVPLLGKLFSARVRAYQYSNNLYDRNDGKEFEHALGLYGGIILKMAGSHMIDMALHLLGRPDSLYANVDYIPNSMVDRRATALFEYDDGLIVNFEAVGHPLRRIGYERNAWDESIEINGLNGRVEIYTVSWDQTKYKSALLIHYDNATETSTEYRYDSIDPFHVEIQHFCDCLSSRVQGKPDVIDGFNVDVMIEAIMESSQKKKAILLDWKGF